MLLDEEIICVIYNWQNGFMKLKVKIRLLYDLYRWIKNNGAQLVHA